MPQKIGLKTIAPSTNPPGIRCEWDDGLTAVISFATLRKECPCAPCKAARLKEPKMGLSLPSFDPLSSKKEELTGINQVGNYAIGLRFADGHDTGIYPFDYLRILAETKRP